MRPISPRTAVLQVHRHADAAGHLRAAPQRHEDGIVGDQHEAAAGEIADAAQFIKQRRAKVMGLINDDERAAVLQPGDDGALALHGRTEAGSGPGGRAKAG